MLCAWVGELDLGWWFLERVCGDGMRDDGLQKVGWIFRENLLLEFAKHKLKSMFYPNSITRDQFQLHNQHYPIAGRLNMSTKMEHLYIGLIYTAIEQYLRV